MNEKDKLLGAIHRAMGWVYAYRMCLREKEITIPNDLNSAIREVEQTLKDMK